MPEVIAEAVAVVISLTERGVLHEDNEGGPIKADRASLIEADL